MKTKHLKRSEALQRIEQRINRWGLIPYEVANVDIQAYGDFSNADVEFIRAETLDEHVRLTKLLADRKIKSLNRDAANLRRKLGYD